MKYLILLAVLLTTGCSYRSYREGNTVYTSIGFLTNQSVAPFSLKAGQKDSASYRELESKGLSNTPDAAFFEAAMSAAFNAGKRAAP